MNGPTRLRDGEDSELRELLRYTQREGRPSGAEIEALTSRVLDGLAADAAGASLPAATGSVVKSIGVAATAGVGVLSASIVVVAFVLRAPEPRAPASRPNAPQAPAAAPESQAAPSEPTPEPVPQPSAAPRPPPKREAPKLRVVRPAPAPAPAPTTEVELLQRAKHELSRAPVRALELLAQHERDHATGVFAEEREALTIEALWRAGRTRQAVQRFEAMREHYPKSPYRERLQALLRH